MADDRGLPWEDGVFEAGGVDWRDGVVVVAEEDALPLRPCSIN